MDKSEGRLWAETRGFLYFETSAQTGENITEMFQVFTDSHHMQMQCLLKNIASTHTHTCTHTHTYTQMLLSSVVSMVMKGDRQGLPPLDLGYTPEQASLVQRVRACQDSHDLLGVSRGCSRWVWLSPKIITDLQYIYYLALNFSLL